MGIQEVNTISGKISSSLQQNIREIKKFSICKEKGWISNFLTRAWVICFLYYLIIILMKINTIFMWMFYF